MSSISAEGAKLPPTTSQNQEVTLKGLKAKITLCLREKLSGAFRCLGQRGTTTRERKITFPAAEERRGGRGALKRSRRSSCRRCAAAKNSGPCEVRKPPVKTSAAQSAHLTGVTSRKKETGSDERISRCLVEDVRALHTAAGGAVAACVTRQDRFSCAAVLRSRKGGAGGGG